MGFTSTRDWEGALRVTSAITPNDSHIVGIVLDVLCHHCFVVVPILPILGVGDIDGVILLALRVVEDEPNWRLVSVVVRMGGVMFMVNGAFFLLINEGNGSDGKLWGEANGGDQIVVWCGIGDGGYRG
jgi:hypothetical protein